MWRALSSRKIVNMSRDHLNESRFCTELSWAYPFIIFYSPHLCLYELCECVDKFSRIVVLPLDFFFPQSAKWKTWRPCLLGGREVGGGKEFDFFSTFHCLVGPSLMELNFHWNLISINLKNLYSLSMTMDFKFLIYLNKKIPILSSKQNQF